MGLLDRLDQLDRKLGLKFRSTPTPRRLRLWWAWFVAAWVWLSAAMFLQLVYSATWSVGLFMGSTVLLFQSGYLRGHWDARNQATSHSLDRDEPEIGKGQ
jgi:hypothetical protein